MTDETTTEDVSQTQPGAVPQEIRTWLIILHLSPLATFAIPLGNILAPLIIWLIKKPESPLIDEHGKEVMNFQISLLIYFAICVVLLIIAIGAILLPLLGLFALVMIVIGAVDASNGKLRRYPATIRFIK